jgi:two-component system sensor histidine kinase VicK
VKDMTYQPISNITFIYDLDIDWFSYVHPSVSYVVKEQDDFSNVFSLVHPDDRDEIIKQFKLLLNGTYTGCSKFRLVLNNEERWFRIAPQLISIKSENLIFGNVMDITAEEHDMETMRKYANKKNSILHLLSHELKGPLGTARNLSKDLYRHLRRDSFVTNHLNIIARIISECIYLVEDFTDREFLETVNIELVKKRVNIAKKISEYIEELNRSETAIERVFSFTTSAKNIYLKIDEAKFIQILNNLVSNSLKFTQPGGRISIHLRNLPTTVIMDFKDNGIGIPEHLLPFIFDEFTKAKRRGLRGEATMGLGLSIVKAIVHWHKGKISVKSEENKGTIFRIEFPKD